MNKEDIKQIRDIVREEVAPLDSRMGASEVRASRLADKLDRVEDKIDELKEKISRQDEKGDYFSQIIDQNHREILDAIVGVRNMEGEDITAVAGDVVGLKKRVVKLEKTVF